jgi:hypothetical protein
VGSTPFTIHLKERQTSFQYFRDKPFMDDVFVGIGEIDISMTSWWAWDRGIVIWIRPCKLALL